MITFRISFDQYKEPALIEAAIHFTQEEVSLKFLEAYQFTKIYKDSKIEQSNYYSVHPYTLIVTEFIAEGEHPTFKELLDNFHIYCESLYLSIKEEYQRFRLYELAMKKGGAQ
ncbi:hypothetical protein [Rhodoflexus caldus]|uniref:hypothetical protein n=1 Tax=Rhodoflexus caldus TaxID=2891236 RepID=UPI00202A94E1|nr:hypothetical protein [Rhodoflexus caldus]